MLFDLSWSAFTQNIGRILNFKYVQDKELNTSGHQPHALILTRPCSLIFVFTQNIGRTLKIKYKILDLNIYKSQCMVGVKPDANFNYELLA